MKKIIAIALMALATAAFGSQASQTERAKLEHIAAVERAKAEQKSRDSKRAMAYPDKSLEDMRRELDEYHTRMAYNRMRNAIDPHPIIESGNGGNGKTARTQKKKAPRNVLGRGVSSGPARRRK